VRSASAVRRGATEDVVAKLADYEQSDLPERTKAALRYVDRLLADESRIEPAFHAELTRHLTDDELLDLGMTALFFSGWQRFNEAFGIVPDGWTEGDRPPFGPLGT
jgi:alkylhydroperoxidase family enzyme